MASTPCLVLKRSGWLDSGEGSKMSDKQGTRSSSFATGVWSLSFMSKQFNHINKDLAKQDYIWQYIFLSYRICKDKDKSRILYIHIW